MEYIGIADAHGLESFIPAKKFDIEEETFSLDTPAIAFMNMRANANRQRHSVVYKVDLSPGDANDIASLYEGGEYIQALEELKLRARSISLIQSPGAEKSWRLIPNPDLDPFS
jgi:hypothetical protein